MGRPDHLTCLLRNLYAGQEAKVRTGHGTTDWFQIGKEYIKAVYCHLAYLIYMQSTYNLYAETVTDLIWGGSQITADSDCSHEIKRRLFLGRKAMTNLLLLLLSHFSRVRLCATPKMAAYQAPPSLGFSRQEYRSGLPFPSPMHESEKGK